MKLKKLIYFIIIISSFFFISDKVIATEKNIYWNVGGPENSLIEYLEKKGFSYQDLRYIKKIKFNDISKSKNIINAFDNEIIDNQIQYGIKNDRFSGNTLYIQFDGKLYLNSNSSWLFTSFEYVSEIEGLQYIDTSKVTNMSFMFNYCRNLVILDLNNFNTSNVTDMSYMFNNMWYIRELDLSSFDTSKVTNMSFMFANMLEIDTLNLSNFNTSNVTNMSYMFHMSHFKNLNLNNINTSNVTDMSYMFRGMFYLENLDILNFNTSNVTNMSHMFESTNLEKLDLSNFNTSKVTDMSRMFACMTNLKILDISNFSILWTTKTEDFFLDSNSLKKLVLPSQTSKVELPIKMFDNNFNEYINLNNIPAERTLHAMYTITFDEINETKDILYDTKYGKMPSPKKNGYTFDGWYTSKDYKNRISNDAIFTGINNITLYPKWEKMFSDIKKTDWFYKEVKYVYDNGIIRGYNNGEYGPYDSLTRYMFVVILHRLENENIVSKKSNFKDIDRKIWYINAIDWAVQNKIIYGYGDNTFRPNKKITREEFITILYRYAKYKGVNITYNKKSTNYSDYNKISSYAIEPIEWSISRNLIYGSDGKINPQKNITRAETAVILYRYLTNYEK